MTHIYVHILLFALVVGIVPGADAVFVVVVVVVVVVFVVVVAVILYVVFLEVVFVLVVVVVVLTVSVRNGILFCYKFNKIDPFGVERETNF